MRVNSRKQIKAITVDDEHSDDEGTAGDKEASAGDDEKAGTTDKTGDAPATSKGKKAATPRKPRTPKRKAASDNDEEDAPEVEEPKPKKARTPRKKKETKSEEKVDDKDWDDILATNLTGAFCAAQAFVRPLIEAQAPGSVVFIGSVNSMPSSMTSAPSTREKAR